MNKRKLTSFLIENLSTYLGEGGESYTDLPYLLYLTNLPPDASPFGRLGQPLKNRPPDVSSAAALSSSTLPISRQKIKMPPYSGDILFFVKCTRFEHQSENLMESNSYSDIY
jgi:hypothetical protein